MPTKRHNNDDAVYYGVTKLSTYSRLLEDNWTRMNKKEQKLILELVKIVTRQINKLVK